jgi:hypothetical protein
MLTGMDSMDNNDTIQFSQPDAASTPGGAASTPGGAAAPGDPASGPAGARRWSGRTKRVVTSVAASAVLLGSGAGIGLALTGGASASTGSGSAGTSASGSAAATAAHSAAGRCAKLMQRLRSNGHPKAASRVQAICRRPLLRLALVGGEHGEVTFQTKSGPKTIAFERGTIHAVSSSSITVVATDGTTWTWDLASNTKLREARQQVTTAKLSTGELILVAGPVVNGTHDARVVRIRSGSGSGAGSGTGTGS